MPQSYDFAIFGSSPLSALLAGLLAHDHGKAVLRLAEPTSPLRLPRGIDLALPLATRPASWRMVRAGEAEIGRVMAALDASDALVRTDVKLVADLPATIDALRHVAHLARQHRLRIDGGIVRQVARLAGEVSLAGSKVQSIEPVAAKLSLPRSGARLEIAGEMAEVGGIVLADDAAILGLLPEEQRPELLVPRSMTATLTAPAKRLDAAVMLYPDRGVTLLQRGDRSVLALIADERDLEARLASTLPGPFPLQRRASTRFRRLTTRDGAPLIGRLKPSKLFVIAGLGDTGAFLAPAIARLLAGVPADGEKQWFALHDPARSNRDAVADLAEALP